MKNLSLHLVLPNERYNQFVKSVITKIGESIDISVDSDVTNFNHISYEMDFRIYPDKIGNPLMIILIAITIIIEILSIPKLPKFVLYFSIASFSSFLFFSLILKWQPWQTRLDLPFFFLLTPLITYCFFLVRWNKFLVGVTYLALAFSLCIILFLYPERHILGKDSVFTSKINKNIYQYDSGKKIEEKLQENNISNVGLLIGSNGLEWTYWLTSSSRNFEYINYPKILIDTPNADYNFEYKAIIVEKSYLDNSSQRIHTFLNSGDIQEIFTPDPLTLLYIYKTTRSDTTSY
ncbi:hypothetical protein M0R04_03935 [Candidatus Dojkabacteria bacterium]|jgi:hypothetical protein|nr:hypothetical protein [Candidatus Dojkabacteria bacterium]